MEYESEKREYKEQFTEDVYKTVIAFANTGGGVLYLGINDQGFAVGLENIDENYTRLTNGIRDSIAPDITMFIRYVLREDNVIEIQVGEGSYKPYYIKKKGLKPTGVYVRQGASTAQASSEQIRRMIKDADGDVFEELRAMNQELTFSAMKESFQKRELPLSEEKFTSLGLRNPEDKQFTNLAWLLSDQCQHTLKIAVFAGDDKTVFKDRKEFSGSIFRQLEEGYAYLQLVNRTAGRFSGLERIDLTDYPEDALREALLNAMIHRDYSFSGSIIINANDAYMEFISLGGLLAGLSKEDICNGISLPRNKKLAELCLRLKLIESYGTGIGKMYRAYKDCDQKPEFIITSNTFKVILPNRNSEPKENEKDKKAKHSCSYLPFPKEINPGFLMERQSIYKPLSLQKKTVLSYLEEHKNMSEKELQELLQIRKTRAYLLSREMQEEGLIVIEGRGEKKVFRLKP